jgi:hypothetical protein
MSTVAIPFDHHIASAEIIITNSGGEEGESAKFFAALAPWLHDAAPHPLTVAQRLQPTLPTTSLAGVDSGATVPLDGNDVQGCRS